MKGIRIKEFLCIVILLIFIFAITNQNKVSDSKPEDVFNKVCNAVNVEGLKKSKAEKFKKEFGFGVNEFEEVYYMSSDSIMDVREYLVIRLGEDSPTDDLMDSIKKRIEEKQNLFKGYAPKESELLSKYVLEKKSGFVFFAVSEMPRQAASAFKNAL